jgi:hypothetical protein
LVAGCIVVGLAADLNESYHTNFGVRCATVKELVRRSGEALDMPLPTVSDRAVVRDSVDEKRDWLTLLMGLGLHENPIDSLLSDEQLKMQ